MRTCTSQTRACFVEYSVLWGACICERIIDCSDEVERSCSTNSMQFRPEDVWQADRPIGGVMQR